MGRVGRNKNAFRAKHKDRADGDERIKSKVHEDLAEFEQYKADVLKSIRKDIRNKLSARQIREKYLAILQGRLITDALTTEDVKEATTIIKDVADRVEGKATEKKEVTHRFSGMSDKELDAILQSEEKELEDMAQRFDKQQ